MRDDFLGHTKLVQSSIFYIQEGKRSGKAFENCIVTMMYFGKVCSLVN